MTAHDDDQDLVTIRIPRRAAAMYAAELEVASSPWMIRLSVYGGVAAPVTVLMVAVVLALTGVYQVVVDDLFFATNCFVMAAIAGVLSAIFCVVGVQRLRVAKSRALL